MSYCRNCYNVFCVIIKKPHIVNNGKMDETIIDAVGLFDFRRFAHCMREGGRR